MVHIYYVNFTAGPGNDTFQGGVENDYVNGLQGYDTLKGGAGNDTLIGGTDDDYIDGEDDNDSLLGGSGNDLLMGRVGNDYLSGYNGNDYLFGNDGNDTLIGGIGNNTLEGNEGMDTVSFAGGAAVTVSLISHHGWGFAIGQGDDALREIENVLGSSNNDSITGSSNVNSLYGGAGNDTLTGGEGADVLKGNAGADTFVFQAVTDSGLAAATRDRIFGFSQAEGDKIDLTALHLTAFTEDGHFLGHGEGSARSVLQDTGSYQRTMLYVDANGDGHTDMSIQFSQALIALTADDVLL